MASDPVTPVSPVDPVAAIRPLDSGFTYFHHLNEWRIWSEIYAVERRKRDRRDTGDEFARILAECLRRYG